METALEELIAAWRATRDPAVADAIERVGAEIERAAPVVIAGRTVGARLDAWAALAHAARARDVSGLVALPFPTGIKNFQRVTGALCALPEDPRVARKLVELVVAQPVDSIAGRAVTATACLGLARLRDVRGLPALEARAGAVNEYERRAIGIAVALSALRATVPVAADPALLARCAPPARDAAVEAAFLGQIAANPDDDGAIAVYGDWLVENGDPRGELIALQLGAASARGAARVRELVERHGEAWAGDMAPLFTPPRAPRRRMPGDPVLDDHRVMVFERGLFAGGLLARHAHLADVERALPGWRLVTRLCADWDELLDPQGCPLDVPRLAELHIGPRIRTEADAIFAHYPRLATLGLWGDDGEIVRWCRRSPTVERLACLVLRRPDQEILDELAVRAGPREVVLAAGPLRPGWSVTVSRAVAPGPFTHVHAHRTDGASQLTERSALPQLLARIPAESITRVVATAASHAVLLQAREAEAAEAALARFANARIEVPWVRPIAAAAAARKIGFTVNGSCAPTGRVARVLAAVGAIDQRYDVFTNNSNKTRRPLGGDPLARAEKWLAKTWIDLYRTGGDEHLRLSTHGNGIAPIRGLLAVTPAVTPRALRACFAEVFAATHASAGTLGTVDVAHQVLDLGGLPYQVALGWLMVLPPALARWIDPAELLDLARAEPALAALTLVPPAEIASARAPATLAILLGDEPDPRLAALAEPVARVLQAAVLRGFERRHGYAFLPAIRAALAPLADALGARVAVADAFSVRYCVHDHTTALDARLRDGWTDDPPTDDMTLVIDMRHDRWRELVHAPIDNRADLDAALATALAAAGTVPARATPKSSN